MRFAAMHHKAIYSGVRRPVFRTLEVAFFAMLLSIFVVFPQTSFAQTSVAGPVSVADLAERLQGAVVNISTTQSIKGTASSRKLPSLPPGSPFEDFFEKFLDRDQQGNKKNSQKPRPPRKVRSLGSGFVIDSSGIIITNNHVIADADEITANFSDGTKLKAVVIGRDPKVDVAVLRVKAAKPLTAVSFGESKKLRVGDWVMAIGNPFGLGGTVTLGIVSARDRDINSGPYDNFIQTDASINKGNSGGPLFNMAGQVIGINTAIISPSGGSIGIGFAVPAATIAPVIAQLREFGETRRGWLGVRIQSVTDEIAESLGMEKKMGALIANVNPKGPAFAGGMKAGDIITKFNDVPVAQMRDLPRIVADTPVGKQVDVIVLRKGAEKTLRIKIARLDEKIKKASLTSPAVVDDGTKRIDDLGLSLSSLNNDLRKKHKIGKKVAGVVIVDVDPASIAAEKGIKAGDVISEVGQEIVKSPEDVEKRIKELQKLGRKSALLLVVNGKGDLRFVAVKISK